MTTPYAFIPQVGNTIMTEHTPQGYKPEESDRADESIRVKVSAEEMQELKAEEFFSRNREEDVRLFEAEANLFRRLSKEEQFKLAEYKVIRDKILDHQEIDWTKFEGGSA